MDFRCLRRFRGLTAVYNRSGLRNLRTHVSSTTAGINLLDSRSSAANSL